MMTRSEYRRLSDALRAPYDTAMQRYAAEQSELNTARVFREFDRYDSARSQLFDTFCKVGIWN